MAHSNNIISSIKLPNGVTYEIHDAQAIHTIEELGLGSALVFKGVKDTYGELPTSGNKVGDVWHVKADDYEYVWAMVNGTTGSWEEFGAPHDFIGTETFNNHKHGVTVTGTNAESTVTGTVTVPTVSSGSKYVKASVSRGEVTTDTALGTGATFSTTVTPNTTNVKATASGTAVGANGTAAAITGFGAHSTDTALGTNATFAVSGGTASTSKMVTTTVKNPSVSDANASKITSNTDVKASKVSSAGSKTNGSAASWTATVTDGVLSFAWTANVPTAVTLPTFTEVTASKIAAEDVAASKVTTSNVTVATGALATNGAGADVATGISEISVAVSDADAVEAITALGTPTTANALTGVKITAQPTITLATGAATGTGVISVATGIKSAATNVSSADTVTALTNVPVPTVALSKDDSTSTGAVSLVDSVSVGSTNASITNGKAAAQTWTQKSGTTGTPN